ncbi:serine-threonine protein kinase 19 [Thamnocephalis sphaerospora]|uniref:Serine-threonine protein kinase 19 n=1 Tax=Thamnocephalis sphaerospora TaxID=78915 RepID=A0A4P9XPS8_9FUNG|nr:serine-threonine protein kinase 19 [Thamnocephalis sphaerospora]|eukprot:RKP07270.1 serine-threonine protein kinase 19 [Thamnocephalis sphaerospora]
MRIRRDIPAHHAATHQAAEQRLPRVFLRHQLYVHNVADARTVNVTMDRLCNRGHLLCFPIGDAGFDDMAMMRSTDYAQLLANASAQAAVSMPASSGDNVFCRLEHAVRDGAFTSVQIAAADLHRQLGASDDDAAPASGCSVMLDDQLTKLVAAGFLVTLGPTTYALAAPGLGRLALQLTRGRRELLQWLRRRRYKEAPLRQAEEKRMRFATLLDNRYIVCDLIGSGMVERFHTTSGWFLRLSSKGERAL